MKLNELKKYSQNNFDKEIIDRMSKDSDTNLNNYIINVICDLLQNIPIEESLINSAKENINKYEDNNIGKLSTYISLIPYVQLKLKDRNDSYIIVNLLLEILISYMVGYVNEEAFNNKLLEIKETLQISEEFYKQLVYYFASNKLNIVDGINKKMK
ncbi:MAG: hypothetical protein ACRC3Y_08270 [Romboutsia sp.]|uniref:hypothetical protein n=1 Tax=Romboutsia sp. TaxID=1965302 RepID=UPI003F3DC87D